MSQTVSPRIGHYILENTIGSGGFARVKAARHELTGVRVAVKIINKARMRNKNMISKVKRQIRILKFINHPNIIKLYEVLDTTSDIYVVMEMAAGEDLYKYIDEHDLTEEQAKNFFVQIISGVEAAHLNLVAHRDLKPENVLLDSSYNVKIADFGLSNLMKDGKFLKTSCGSLNYAAPQILGHKSYEGTSADIWSCGIILYTMLVGALPFDEEVHSVLYKKIQKAEFTVPSTVTPLAEDLLRRMIHPIPQSRIKIRDIKLHPWVRKTIPIYAKLPSLSPPSSGRGEDIDEAVLEKVRSYNMESLRNNNNEDRIKRILRGRIDASFVTAYELLRDEKYKKKIEAEKRKDDADIIECGLILEPVNSKLDRDRVQLSPQFVYGHSYPKTARLVIDKIIHVFHDMKIDYSIKNNQYCLLCSMSPQPTFNRMHKERVRRQRVAFGMQLFSKGREVVVDLRMAEGHPLAFLNLSRQFFKRLGESFDD